MRYYKTNFCDITKLIFYDIKEFICSYFSDIKHSLLAIIEIFSFPKFKKSVFASLKNQFLAPIKASAFTTSKNTINQKLD